MVIIPMPLRSALLTGSLDTSNPSSPSGPRSVLIARKSILRRDTRARIPWRVCSLSQNLSLVGGVSLRRLRAGAAFIPAITCTCSQPWEDNVRCPKCHAYRSCVCSACPPFTWDVSWDTVRESARRAAKLSSDQSEDYERSIMDTGRFCSICKKRASMRVFNFLPTLIMPRGNLSE